MNNYGTPVTLSGNQVSFSAPQGGRIDALSVNIVPSQDLHGYTKPWPAGGGKNLINVQDQTITGVSKIADITTVGVTYTASAYISDVVGSNGGRIRLQYELNGTTTYSSNGMQETGRNTATLEIPSGATNAAVYLQRHSNATSVKFSNIMLEVGATATPYAPYSNICPINGLTGLSVYVSPTQDQQDATTYAEDWTSQAGTVYGGTLDVTTGVLTVDRVMVDLGTLNWNYVSGSAFNLRSTTNIGAFPPATTAIVPNAISSIYPVLSYLGVSDTDKSLTIVFATSGAAGRVWVHDTSYTDATSFKTAMSGVQLVYELATPVTYQLTPTQISLLTGQNYLWADTGDISLTYEPLLFVRFTFTVNSSDLSQFVERDSYSTSLKPVYSDSVVTMNGVEHIALLRLKGALTVGLNPQTDADTATICTALLNSPCQVTYHCLQRNADVAARMYVDTLSAQFLSRCLYLGQKWNDIKDITLTEL